MRLKTCDKGIIIVPENKMDYYHLGAFILKNLPYKLDVARKPFTNKKQKEVEIKGLIVTSENLLKHLIPALAH